jgi:hypothetical protein
MFDLQICLPHVLGFLPIQDVLRLRMVSTDSFDVRKHACFRSLELAGRLSTDCFVEHLTSKYQMRTSRLSLVAEGEEFSDRGLEMLSTESLRLSSLVIMLGSSCAMTEKGIVAFLGACIKNGGGLQELDLGEKYASCDRPVITSKLLSYLAESAYGSTMRKLKVRVERLQLVTDSWILSITNCFSELRELRLTKVGMVTAAGAQALGRLPLHVLHMPDSKLMCREGVEALIDGHSNFQQHINDLDLNSTTLPYLDGTAGLDLLATAGVKLKRLKLSLQQMDTPSCERALPQFLTALAESLSVLTLIGSATLQVLDLSVAANLQSVQLYGDLRSLSVIKATGCKKLQALSIAHTPLLQVMDITGCTALVCDPEQLAALLDPRQRPKLEELGAAVKAGVHFRISNNKSLTTVRLEGADEGMGGATLEGTQGRLEGVSTEAEALLHIPLLHVSFNACRGLRSLSLHRCDGLRSLSLSYCSSLDDESIAALLHTAAHTRTLSTLTILKLSSIDKLTDISVRLVAQLCPQLCHLDLSYCSQISDQALVAVSTIATMKTLELYNCRRVTAEGIRPLHQLQQLELLVVCWCKKISQQALDELRAVLPAVHIRK